MIAWKHGVVMSGTAAICALVVFRYPMSRNANAQSLEVREAIAAKEKELAEEIARNIQDCEDLKLPASIDWPSFLPHFNDKVVDYRDGSPLIMTHCSKPSPLQGAQCVIGICSRSTEGIGAVCRTAEGLKAVKKSIKSIRCAYDGNAKGKYPTVELKNGVLSVNYNWNQTEQADGAEAVQKYLLSHL